MKLGFVWMGTAIASAAVLAVGTGISSAQEKAGALGVFEEQADVGKVNPPGTAKFESGVYTVSAAGANMWSREDAFHFVWKRLSGDAVLAAAKGCEAIVHGGRYYVRSVTEAGPAS